MANNSKGVGCMLLKNALVNNTITDIKIENGLGVVKLSDVADVFIADNTDEVYAKINGKEPFCFASSAKSGARIRQ